MPGFARNRASGGTGGSCTRVRFGVALRACAIFSFALNTHAAQDAPLSPQEALAAFQHDPTVRIELVASEPLVFDPIALCFDAQGRMFVIENSGYPTDADPPLGKIVLLEDTDNDTAMDKRTVFADGFDFPSGIMPWRDGLLVICAPDVLHLKDTDGDGRADAREVLLTGFSTGGSTQLRSSHPTLALDGWIYFTNGLSGGDVRRPSDPPEAAVKMGNMDLRWNPWDGRIETTTGQAQYGQAFDEFGNRFICSNRKHIEQVMLQPGDLARNPFLPQTTLTADIPDHGAAAKIFPISSNVTTAYSHGGTFTAACGLVIYRGNAMPECHGNAFVCDPTGNLVHRDILEYNGAACTARHPYGDREFLASTDNWFRPVFLANAPDGALYLCDMYRKTIEHPVYLPPEVAAKTDFESGRDRGRIYRIRSTYERFWIPNPTLQWNTADPHDLLSRFDHNSGWQDATAFRLLLESRDSRVELAASTLAMSVHQPERQSAALAVLGALGSGCDKYMLGLDKPSEHPLSMLARTVPADCISLDLLVDMLESPHYSVQFHAALAAHAYPGDGDTSVTSNMGPYLYGTAKRTPATDLANLVLRAAGDPWIVNAVFTSAPTFLSEFLAQLLPALEMSQEPFAPGLVNVAHLAGRTAGLLERPQALVGAHCIGAEKRLSLPWRIAFLAGVIETWPRFRADPSTGRLAQLFLEGVSREDIQALTIVLAKAIEAPALTMKERLHALRVLEGADTEVARATMESLLNTPTPPELQAGAVRALATIGDERAGDFLLADDRWNVLGGDARVAARAAVLANPAWAKRLLEKMVAGQVSPFTLDPSARAQLAKSQDSDIAALAQKAFANVAAIDRTKAYEEQRDLLTLTPDPANGRAVYAEQCAQCHVFKGEGHNVGPELSDMSLQTPDYILLHLIDPNKAVTAGFESYTVNTTMLDTHIGILAAQNDTAITLRQALGTEQTIPRAEIDTLTTENRSLMPEELEKVLSKQQIRDLIGFLRGE